MQSFISSTVSLLLFIWYPLVLADFNFVQTKTNCRTKYAATPTSNVPTVSRSSQATATYSFTSTYTPIEIAFTPETVTFTTGYPYGTTVTATAESAEDPITTTTTTIETFFAEISGPIFTTRYPGVYIDDTFTKLRTGGAAITPIADTLPSAVIVSARKRSVLERRQNGPQYPNRVICNLVTESINIIVTTSTAPTSTVTPPPTLTEDVEEINYYTTTSTVYPPNTFSTITEVETSTITYNVTHRVTSYTSYSTRVASITKVISIYPQCTGRNVAFAQGYEPSDSSVSVREWGDYHSLEKTAEECCSICLDDPACAFSYYYIRASGGSRCRLVARADGVCNPADPLLVRAVYNRSPYIGDDASNGKCGIFNSRVDT